jgi:tetratricopeptide (TPR) repeat protein
MSRLGQVLSVVVVLCGFAASTWAADIIELRGEAIKLNGTVSDVTKDKVTMKTTKDETKEIPVSQIVDITWTGEPSALKTGRNHEIGGRLTQAAEAYVKAATDYKGDGPLVKNDIEYFATRVEVKQALNDPAKLDAALKRVSDFAAKNGNSRHFYEASNYILDLNLVKKDAAGAKTAAEALARAPGNEQKMVAKIGLGRVAILENQVADAQKSFEEVAAMPATGAQEEGRKQEAKLWVAQCLFLEKKYEEAIKLLDDVIAKAAPENSHVQAAAYVRQGDCYEALGKSKEALLAYLHVDVLFPTEKAVHPEALYHLSKLWTAVQQPDRASEAVDKLNAEYPNSPWAQKLKGS